MCEGVSAYGSEMYVFTIFIASVIVHGYQYTNTYIHTYIRTYAHTYIHTYVHSYVHTYVHTYTFILSLYMHI